MLQFFYISKVCYRVQFSNFSEVFMNKKKFILILFLFMTTFASGFLLYKQIFPDSYEPANDEIALHIQMDTKEDIGLIVYDYTVNNNTYSGGISNADKSLIKHNSDDNVVIWNKQEFNISSDTVEIFMRFRIITEYVEPNYENVYPKNITKYINVPITWKAQFKKEYFLTITGDKVHGYQAVLNP